MNNSLTYILIVMTICWGCSTHDGLKEDKSHHSLVDKIKHDKRDSIKYQVSTESVIADLEKVLAEVPESEHEFYILERGSMIKSFPCSNCHDSPLEELQESDTTKKAHWDIKLVHAGKSTMDCGTCHNTSDLDKLQTITGKMLTFDHSYKVCAQCHSTQNKDWVGGAHGKREGGWAPPRLILTCVNCHNPHSPVLETRWPARLNTEKLKEIN